MANENWYYSRQGQQLGPISFEALQMLAQTGQVHPDDLVWFEGMANWTAARNVQDLFSPAATAGSAPMPSPGIYAPPGYPTGVGTLGYSTAPQYGGFWLRFCAWFIDQLIMFACSCFVGIIVGVAIGIAAASSGTPNAASPMDDPFVSLSLNLFSVVLGWLYFALMESSSYQATLGKMAVGLKVVDLNGQRISFGRASGRFFAKIISALILLIGYIMAAFTERKQALHDMMAGTLVVRR